MLHHLLLLLLLLLLCTAAADVSVLGFFGEPGVQVLNVCTEGTSFPLVITYNSSSLQHSIWALKGATSVVRLDQG